VAGELYIGGEGLARGYINQPDRTAERFVPNPFAERYNDKALEHLNDLDDERSSARLYRTGDLVRYAPDGAIEYLGRLDHQVKLRGFRIELGEIEAALARHQQVQAVLVVVREDVPGDRHLVAYVVPSDEGRRAESPSDEAAGAADTDLVLRLPSLVSELRVWLKPLLPSYMIPAAFVVLERMPLTPNGKIDRRALPAPEQVRPDLEVAFVAPRTPTEQAIAQIWVEVLGIAQVGLHDSFFDLGGHSLLAMQVLTRLRETFQLDLSLSSLFEHPSVAELAELVVGQQIADSDEDTLAQLLAEIEQLDGDTVTDVAEAL
jgi:acyl carrier protein